MANKVCSKCKAEFICHANSNGCWCEQYQLSEQSLQYLKNSFDDCLCEQCLRSYDIVNSNKED